MNIGKRHPDNGKSSDKSSHDQDHLLRVIFDHHPHSSCLLDSAGRILVANPAFLKLSGSSREEIFGRPMWDVPPWKGKPESSQAIRDAVAAMRKEKVISIETDYIADDGSMHTFLLTFTSINDERGESLYIVLDGYDITESAKTIQALHKAQEIFDIIANTVPIIYWAADADGTITLSEGGGLKRMGTQPGEHVGTSLYELYPENTEVIHRILKGESFTERREAGGGVWETTCVPVHDDEGKLMGSVGVTLDVTEGTRAEEELRKTQALLAAAVENSPYGIIIADAPDVRIRMINKAALDISGRSFRELTDIPMEKHPVCWQAYRPDGQLFAPDELPLSRAVLEGKVSMGVEAVIRQPGGEDRWISASAAPVRDDDGRIIAGVAILHDMTEQKLADNEIHRQKKTLQTYINTAGVMFLALGADERVTMINSKGCEVLGYDKEEIIGKNWFDTCIPPEKRDEIRSVFHKLIAGGVASVEYYVNQIITKDGSEKIILWHNALLKDENGNFLNIISSGLDITEQKKVETELRESEKRYRSLFENLYDAVFVMRGDLFADCNRKAVEMFGCRRDDLIGHTPYELSPKVQPDGADSREKARLLIESALRGEIDSFEWLHRKCSGETFYVEVHLNRIDLKDGSHLLAILRDITERTALQRQIEESHYRLELMSRELLDSQEQEKRRIARELHDETGQLLTAMKINLQYILHRRNSDLHREELLKRLSEQVDLIDTAIQQVRSLSQELRPSILDDIGLVPAMRWYLDRQTQLAELQGSIKEENLPDRIPSRIRIACYRILQEAVTNILRHANATRIDVSLVGTSKGLKLVIRDNGGGFDVKEALERASRGESFGLLGMQERLELLGGKLKISSTPDKGTKIEAVFPVMTDGEKTVNKKTS